MKYLISFENHQQSPIINDEEVVYPTSIENTGSRLVTPKLKIRTQKLGKKPKKSKTSPIPNYQDIKQTKSDDNVNTFNSFSSQF
jgi:hypothetical protein